MNKIYFGAIKKYKQSNNINKPFAWYFYTYKTELSFDLKTKQERKNLNLYRNAIQKFIVW